MKLSTSCTSKCDDAFTKLLKGYWDEYKGTVWMEWTFKASVQVGQNTINGPVHSGYLRSTGSWVYEGGIGDNFADWSHVRDTFSWAWSKADEWLGDPEQPAHDWYNGHKEDDDKEWSEARTSCRGEDSHEFEPAPRY